MEYGTSFLCCLHLFCCFTNEYILRTVLSSLLIYNSHHLNCITNYKLAMLRQFANKSSHLMMGANYCYIALNILFSSLCGLFFDCFLFNSLFHLSNSSVRVELLHCCYKGNVGSAVIVPNVSIKCEKRIC